jgi:hypothetical protein
LGSVSSLLLKRASASRPSGEWRTALRGAGLPTFANCWIDSMINRADAKPSPEAWARHWQLYIEQAGAAGRHDLLRPRGRASAGH